MMSPNGRISSVHESRVEEYKAAGFTLAADCSAKTEEPVSNVAEKKEVAKKQVKKATTKKVTKKPAKKK